MSSAEALAGIVVRAWTLAYTVGAPARIREERRDEIASDLWEHARAGAEEGLRHRAIAGQMLARCFLGIGADVSWRVQVTLGQRRAVEEEVPMSDRMKRSWWIPGTIALIGSGIAFGVMSHTNRIDQGWDPSTLQSVGAVVSAGLLFVVLPLLALLVRRSHPGWTLGMLVPAIVVSLSPLLWLGDAVRELGVFVLPLFGGAIVSLVGALTNLAQASVSKEVQSAAA